MIRAERQSWRTGLLTLTTLTLLLTGPLLGCGMKPPPEYNDVAKSDPVDLTPLDKAEGDAGTDGDAAPEPSEGKLPVVAGLAAIPAIPIANFLGKSRDDIESLFAPLGPEDPANPAGWVRYTDHLKLLYVNEAVSELAQQVPSGLSCVEAAKWLGFTEVDEPSVSDDRCTWTGKPGNALGAKIAGEVSVKAGLFHARLVK